MPTSLGFRVAIRWAIYPKIYLFEGTAKTVLPTQVLRDPTTENTAVKSLIRKKPVTAEAAFLIKGYASRFFTKDR